MFGSVSDPSQTPQASSNDSPLHTPAQSTSAEPSHSSAQSNSASPPHVPAQSCCTDGNANTVPSFNAANKPKAGSSPDKNPDANTTTLSPPSPDNGAVNTAITSSYEVPAGAIPTL